MYGHFLEVQRAILRMLCESVLVLFFIFIFFDDDSIRWLGDVKKMMCQYFVEICRKRPLETFSVGRMPSSPPPEYGPGRAVIQNISESNYFLMKLFLLLLRSIYI